MPFRIFFRHVADDYEADTLEESSTSSLAPCAYEGTVLQTGTLPVCTRPDSRCEERFLKWIL